MSGQTASFSVKASHKFVGINNENTCANNTTETNSSLYSLYDESSTSTTKPTTSNEAVRKGGNTKGMTVRSTTNSLEDYY